MFVDRSFLHFYLCFHVNTAMLQCAFWSDSTPCAARYSTHIFQYNPAPLLPAHLPSPFLFDLLANVSAPDLTEPQPLLLATNSCFHNINFCVIITDCDWVVLFLALSRLRPSHTRASGISSRSHHDAVSCSSNFVDSTSEFLSH
jgi:hypothetical protein